jgi:hypothetical protein
VSRFSPGFIYPANPNTITNFLYGSTTVATGGSPSADVTFAGVAVGTARATRYVVAVIWDLGDNNVPSGASIGGVTATILYDPTATPHSPYCFGALVPSGTTADVTINYPATQAGTFACSVYTMDGTPSSANGQFYSGTVAGFTGLTVAAKANGAVIAGFQNGKAAGSPSSTWVQGSPTMTADFTNTVFTTSNYVSGRSKAGITVDANQDWGSLSGGAVNIKAFLLNLIP